MLALQCYLCPQSSQLMQNARLHATAGPSQAPRMKPTQPSSTGLACKAYAAAFQRPYYQDNAYFSDDDVSDVEAVLSADEASSWLDANYVSLSVTCYKLIQKQSQAALQNHFAKQQERELKSVDSPAWPTPHHACCAPGRDHTFVCGEDQDVAWAVAPASIKTGDHFIGTP